MKIGKWYKAECSLDINGVPVFVQGKAYKCIGIQRHAQYPTKYAMKQDDSFEYWITLTDAARDFSPADIRAPIADILMSAIIDGYCSVHEWP